MIIYWPSNLGSAPSWTGDCEAGYLCISGSSFAAPVDGVKGMKCPVGSYCPSGTPVPIACPPGTFNNQTGENRLNINMVLHLEGSI